MKEFHFSNDVITEVIEELQKADNYIKIAVFQLHRLDLFQVLNKKLDDNVDVEIFTLPYDSINAKNYDQIVKRFEELKTNGAEIYFCKWNVGNPSRTTTAVGKWYSFHGKFIVTDKAAIAMSANFTDQDELDAMLIFRENKKKINEFNQKFRELKELFIIEQGKYNGIIRQTIINTKVDQIDRIFTVPKNVDSKLYKNHWIRDYPSLIFRGESELQDELLIIPFHGKGREIYRNILSRAEDFILLSTETFTDPDFPNFLIEMALEGKKIKILSGIKTMDFRDRVQRMFRELLAQDIEINTTTEDLHAKLIITDKDLVLSSINLNRISLGFERRKGYWRENTEIVYICNEKTIIESARQKFEEIFNSTKSVRYNLSEKLGEDLADKIRTIFKVYAVSGDVKQALGKLFLRKELEIKSEFMNLGQKISEIIEYSDKSMINLDHLGMAYVIHLISNNVRGYREIQQKFKALNLNVQLNKCINKLLNARKIEKKDDQFFLLDHQIKKTSLDDF